MKVRKNKQNCINIYNFDYDSVILYGLNKIISRENGLQVCGATTDANMVIKDLKLLKPHILTVEPFSPFEDSNGLIKEVLLMFPEIVILLISYSSKADITKYLPETNALNHIMKSEPISNIISTIKNINRKKLYALFLP